MIEGKKPDRMRLELYEALLPGRRLFEGMNAWEFYFSTLDEFPGSQLTSDAPAAPRARPSAAACTTKPTVAVVAFESEIVLSVSPLK